MAETDEYDPRFDQNMRRKLSAEHASLLFMLSAAYANLYDATIKIEHSLGDGVYCIDLEGHQIDDQVINEVKNKLNEMLSNDIPIEFQMVGRTELLKFFQDLKRDDKVGVLKAWQDHFIPCVTFDGYIDYKLEEMSTDKERLKIFDIIKYDDGLIIRYPTMMNPNSIPEWKDRPVLHAIFKETAEWANILRADNCAQLNEAIYTKRIEQLRMINEGLHEKKIAQISHHLVDNFHKKRVVTIAGASSSNKTTFAKRLCIHLKVAGYGATLIEMDDYFQDGHKIPVDKSGKKDLEHISAMNVSLLAERVHKLLAGESIPVRKYNFPKAIGEDDPNKKFNLPEKNFLILEGIHGLNPELLEHIGKDIAIPLYVCALTPIHIDNNYRFTTSDLRLIRRCIRDHNYRGCSVRWTLKTWTTVRVGEERNIFPYHENAEMFFNSALLYELNALSIKGRVIFSHATFPDPNEDSKSDESKFITSEAQRLLSLLNLFYPLSSEKISRISTIREFIGGSDFKY